jgi:DUF4097 and DUF4098 domain-containing protein YvlB
MRKHILHIATACALLTGAGAALAASPYADIAAGDTAKTLDASWPIAADGRIDIGNVRGKVTVTGWDQPQVKLEGSLGAESTLAVSGAADRLSLRVKSTEKGWFGSDGPQHDSVLILHVPRKAALEVNVVSADADVADVAGKSLKLGSVSGDVQVASAAADIEIDSVSGDVIVSAPGAQSNTHAHVQTVSGDVHAKNLAGQVKLETVSGDMECACGAVSELTTGSVSGDVDITAAPAAAARLHLESMSGNVRLHLPANLSAQIDASTFSGNVRSDFGAVEHEEYGAGSSLKARVGGGDAQIHAESFSGDIDLRKQ